MRIAICDDEIIFREQIKKYILEVSSDSAIYEYTCGDDLADSTENLILFFLT